MANPKILPSNKICEQCRAPFRAQRNRAPKVRFCSRECFKAARRANSTAVTINCVRCGKERTIPKCKVGKVTGCGMKCRDQRQQKICVRCLQPFLVHAFRAEDASFCSRQCASTAKRSPAQAKTKCCLKCKVEKAHDEFKPYPRSPDGRMATCRDCRGDINRAHRRAKINTVRLGEPRYIPTNGFFTAAQWESLKAFCGFRCLACKRQVNLIADHVIPLARKGRDSIDNIQPLCEPCNHKKCANSTDYRSTELLAIFQTPPMLESKEILSS